MARVKELDVKMYANLRSENRKGMKHFEGCILD
jgi:hypothetical protein